MGRTTEPTQAKVIKGTFRADRHVRETAAPIGAPKCPTWLPKSARKYWRQIGPELARHGLISVVDGAVFSIHCDSVGRFEEITRRLQELSDCIDETPNGYQVQSVYFTIRSKLIEQVMTSAREFGLTPVARNKVKAIGKAPPPGGDDWQDV